MKHHDLNPFNEDRTDVDRRARWRQYAISPGIALEHVEKLPGLVLRDMYKDVQGVITWADETQVIVMADPEWVQEHMEEMKEQVGELYCDYCIIPFYGGEK